MTLRGPVSRPWHFGGSQEVTHLPDCLESLEVSLFADTGEAVEYRHGVLLRDV
jgi:hypothetical protein